MSDEDESDSSASSEPEQKKKGRGQKEKKEEGIKRPRTAFMYFSQARRPALKKSNPGSSFGELVKLIAAEWASASAATKAPFEKQAEEDKQRFTDEGGKTGKGSKGSKGTKKAKTGPKNPVSAYMFFASDKRVALKEEDSSLTFGELGKAVGKAWNEASDAEKAKYVKMAAKDRARYEAEKAANPTEKKAAPAKKRKAKKEASAEEEESESGSEEAE